MRLETFKIIMRNKDKFWYNAADGTGGDTSTDPGAAATVNPNDYLSPLIGNGGVIRILVIIALVLVIIYLVEKDFFTKTVTAVVASTI